MLEFPTKEQIAEAHKRMGIDPTAPEWVCCDKCGAPVETSMMALICPFEQRCAFWNEGCAELKASLVDVGAIVLPDHSTEVQP